MAPPLADGVLEQRLCLFAVLLLAISPLASFALCAFMLINLSAYTPREVRWTLEFAAAMSLAMMAGARPLDPNDLSADILTYYDVYRDLAAGNLDALTTFGGGFEVTLPLLFWLWVQLLPPLSVNGLMFCLALTGTLLLVLWAERSFYRRAGPVRPALAGICLVLLNIYFATQLSRQFLSLIVLLFAFTAGTRSGRLLYVTLAASLHLSALPFYALWLLARRGWPGWLAILGLVWLLRIYFLPLLAALDVVPDVVIDRLAYYVDNEDQSTEADIGSLRMVFLLGLLSVVSLLASRLRPDARTRPWLAAPWLTIAVHYLLLPIPLASLRVTLMVHSVASGFIAYQMFFSRARRLLSPTLNALLLYKVAAFALATGGSNLRSSSVMVGGFLL